MIRRRPAPTLSRRARLSPRWPVLTVLGATTPLLLALPGCATASGDAASSSRVAVSAASATTATPPASANLGYGWHEPKFYQPWFDPSSIVLPPPPFTGFSADGKIAPMLPTRPRPAGGMSADEGGGAAPRP